MRLALERSSDLYAHAAAGPEYEYPAWLLETVSWYCKQAARPEKLTHGAMMTLAPGIGKGVLSMAEGTCESHWSSSVERVEAREEYQEPAWLATLVVMLADLQAQELLWARRDQE